jgi:hypothetical protein
MDSISIPNTHHLETQAPSTFLVQIVCMLQHIPCSKTPNWILSATYTLESLGRPSPAALTYDLILASLITNPNLR